jgi:hypothetical protein
MIVRQAENFPPAAGILRIEGESVSPKGGPDTEATVWPLRRFGSDGQNARPKFARALQDKITCVIKFLNSRGSRQLPRQLFHSDDFSPEAPRHIVNHCSVQGQ